MFCVFTFIFDIFVFMLESHKVKYIAINSIDRKWGIAVESVGMRSKESGADHPSGLHPANYMFTKTRGRVLSSFQILYLIRGHGTFACSTMGRGNHIPLHEGDIFILFPGEWHTYYADPGSVWDEAWIGFEGIIPSRWVEEGILSASNPIFRVGMRQEIIMLYKEALEVATEQRPGFQQVLGSIAMHLVALAVYCSKNSEQVRDEAIDSIIQAKAIIDRELQTITPECLAERTAMSYSRFRVQFKNHTGFSPGKYIFEAKMLRAQEKLTRTNIPVKAVALDLGFENVDYFVTAFKRHTGMRPGDYRRIHKGEL